MGEQGAAAPPGLVAELWYADPPDLDATALMGGLRELSPTAERQADSMVVPHDDGAEPPLLTVVFAGDPLGVGGKTLPSSDQTWDWPGAEDALAGCRASLLVTEMFAADRDRQVRADAMSAVVAALVAATAPRVVSWPLIQRLSDPGRLTADGIEGVLNLRLFSIANDPGVLVVDTLGLHLFGLPDLQCHFRGREPGEIAALLMSTAEYLFDEGDVIADGDTVAGPGPDEHARLFREQSLLEPARLVLDVDLGDPWAAGERDRTD